MFIHQNTRFFTSIKNKHMNPPSTLQQEGMMLNGQKHDDTI